MLGLALATALVLLGLAKPAVHPALGAPDPSLTIDAPRSVKAGYPIEISLSVQGAEDVGGYEANVLFDKKAAEFASVAQEDKDLGDAGRDAEPLGFVETSRGASFGGFSCPVDDCVELGGPPKVVGRGVGGSVELGTLTVIPERAGKLEMRLVGTKVVDAAGGKIAVNPTSKSLTVQVGRGGRAEAGNLHAAPARLPWKPGGAVQKRRGPSDLTEDGRVTNADAMEAAISWMRARQEEAPCGRGAQDSGGDVNGDGCVDVADVQAVAADHGDAAATGDEAATGSGEEGGGLPGLALGGLSALLEWAAPHPAQAQAASAFTVDSAADDPDSNAGDGRCATAQGACTLRAAIEEANLHTGPDAINFDIPGSTGVKTITLGSTLPTVNDTSGPTTIDGYTQPGSSPNTDPRASNARIGVQITPSGTYTAGVYGLTVTSPGNVVRGLSFYKLSTPLVLYGGGATNNTIAGNFVGTNAAATFAATSFLGDGTGVTLQNGASRNVVGGTSVADRNVLSGNARHGVAFYGQTSDSNRVINNIMGLSPAGDRRLANFKHGIDINGGSSQNKIGGTLAGEGNVISGNVEVGVEISHEAGTTENEVVGNLIGTDLSGEGAPAHASNGLEGVNLEDRITNNLVAGNVIANNAKEGIRGGPQVHGTVVRGNRVGISKGGAPMPNALAGVQIQGTSTGWRIGPGNTVAHNRGGGVRVINVESDRNTVTRNSVFSNTGLGIDLDPLNTPNQNDAGDADDGPNDQLNFPVISMASPQQVSGTACAGCTVEVFVADSGANAYGEGKAFLASTTAGGDGRFSVALSGVAVGSYVTATATDAAGNTSEFSSNNVVSNDTTSPSAALSFDGVNDWVSVPSSNLLNTASTAARTYEALIKTGSDVSKRQFVYEEGGSGNGLSVEVSGGRVHFSAWSTTNSWGTVSASAPVAANTSYHVAGVYDRTGGTLKIYLDGVLQGTSSGAVGAMPSHGDGVAIGGISGSTRDHANAVLTSGNHFGGKVGEFAAWNHARTAAQVAADAQSDLQGNEAGLILLYKVQEGSGTVLGDSSPNRLNATINGASWTTQ